MGVDLKGNDGTWFRNNWWWWRPLAEYCFAVAPDVCNGSHHFRQWSTNDGSMTAEEALRLRAILVGELNAGKTRAHAQQRRLAMENMDDIGCETCHGTGKFNRLDLIPGRLESLKLIETMGAPEGIDPELKGVVRQNIINEVIKALKEPGLVECHMCHGYGKVRPPPSMYHFDEANVREFVDFLEHCGGFEVR